MLDYIVFGLISVLGGLITWAFGIGSRIAVLEARLEERWESVDKRLERIEKHVLNGSYRDERS